MSARLRKNPVPASSLAFCRWLKSPAAADFAPRLIRPPDTAAGFFVLESIFPLLRCARSRALYRQQTPATRRERKLVASGVKPPEAPFACAKLRLPKEEPDRFRVRLREPLPSATLVFGCRANELAMLFYADSRTARGPAGRWRREIRVVRSPSGCHLLSHPPVVVALIFARFGPKFDCPDTMNVSFT